MMTCNKPKRKRRYLEPGEAVTAENVRFIVNVLGSLIATRAENYRLESDPNQRVYCDIRNGYWVWENINEGSEPVSDVDKGSTV